MPSLWLLYSLIQESFQESRTQGHSNLKWVNRYFEIYWVPWEGWAQEHAKLRFTFKGFILGQGGSFVKPSLPNLDSRHHKFSSLLQHKVFDMTWDFQKNKMIKRQKCAGQQQLMAAEEVLFGNLPSWQVPTRVGDETLLVVGPSTFLLLHKHAFIC